jgi:hypothetical protein
MPKPRNKNRSGKHKTPRVALQVPEDWCDVLEELAAAQRMPRVWLLIDMIRAAAVAAGKDAATLPPMPWEKPKA